MKKVFLSLFVAGALSFGLQSCGGDECSSSSDCGTNETCVDGNCETATTTCEMCGTYDGSADGTLRFVPLINTDSTITMPSVTGTITEVATDDTKLDLTLNLVVSGVTAPVTVRVDKTSSTTFSVSNTEATILGAYTVKITTGTGTYNATTGGLVANIQIDDPDSATSDNINGNLTYTGTKQ